MTKLTRRQFTAAVAAAAIDPAGVYRSLLGRTRSSSRMPVEQHVVPGLRIVRDQGVAVVVPPLRHRVVTAKVTVHDSAAALREAREALEEALARLEADYPLSPAGLCVTVAWGLPYVRRFVPAQARRSIPIDLRASATLGREVRVVEDATRFPSDPATTILEANDVAVLLRGDSLAAIEDAEARLFEGLRGVFAKTSVRDGFVGGGLTRRQSLPKTMAMRARIAGAALIPPKAELFLGFTSTVSKALGPTRIANFETLGYARLPDPYFAGGTHMHLSHLFQDVNAWYLNFDRAERVGAMFRPGLVIEAERRTVRQNPADVQTAASLRAGYER